MQRLFAMLVFVGCVGSATLALAQAPLNPSMSLRDNLAALAQSKKPATIVMRNGESYRAKVASVSDTLVLLTEPYQKEVFDVLVVIDEIAALEVRAREK